MLAVACGLSLGEAYERAEGMLYLPIDVSGPLQVSVSDNSTFSRHFPVQLTEGPGACALSWACKSAAWNY